MEVVLNQLFAPVQLLTQDFEVLVIGRMEDAQGIVIAADDDAVEVLHVDMGLSVKMCACVTAFGDEDFNHAGVGDGNRTVGHGCGQIGTSVKACKPACMMGPPAAARRRSNLSAWK